MMIHGDPEFVLTLHGVIEFIGTFALPFRAFAWQQVSTMIGWAVLFVVWLCSHRWWNHTRCDAGCASVLDVESYLPDLYAVCAVGSDCLPPLS